MMGKRRRRNVSVDLAGACLLVLVCLACGRSDLFAGRSPAGDGRAADSAGTGGDAVHSDPAAPGDPTSPPSIVIDGPSRVAQNRCSAPFDMVVTTSATSPAPLLAAGSGLSIFADAACTTAFSATVSASQPAARLYLQSAALGPHTLTAIVGNSHADHVVDVVVPTVTLRTTTGGPGPLHGAAAAYDPTTGAVLIYGGGRQTSPANSDMWAYADGTWTQLCASCPPGPRIFTCMVYDEAHARHVLVGGISKNTDMPGVQDSDVNGSLWSYQGGSWTALVTSGSTMPDRFDTAAAYDPDRQRVVIFSGETSLTLWDDGVYELDGSVLSGPFTPAPSPGPRYYHDMTWDPVRRKVVSYGGGRGGVYWDDLQAWDGSVWEPICDPCSDGARLDARLAYDWALGALVLVGGYGASFVGTWIWNGTQFTPFDATTPGTRDAINVAYDRGRDTLVMYGGNGVSCPGPNEDCSDVYELR